MFRLLLLPFWIRMARISNLASTVMARPKAGYVYQVSYENYAAKCLLRTRYQRPPVDLPPTRVTRHRLICLSFTASITCFRCSTCPEMDRFQDLPPASEKPTMSYPLPRVRLPCGCLRSSAVAVRCTKIVYRSTSKPQSSGYRGACQGQGDRCRNDGL